MKYLGEILNGSILNGSSGFYLVCKNQVLFDSSKLLTLVWLCGRLVGSHEICLIMPLIPVIFSDIAGYFLALSVFLNSIFKKI